MSNKDEIIAILQILAILAIGLLLGSQFPDFALI